MRFKEIEHVRTGLNFFNTAQEIIDFRNTKRDLEYQDPNIISGWRALLQQDGALIEDSIVLDSDGLGYTTTRIWRSIEDYTAFTNNTDITQARTEGFDALGWTKQNVSLQHLSD